MLMMNLTQINRRKRCVNIPRSKKAATNKSVSVEDARSHTNTITKHARVMMSLHAKKVLLQIFVFREHETQTPK